jgi:hypothetical protein
MPDDDLLADLVAFTLTGLFVFFVGKVVIEIVGLPWA